METKVWSPKKTSRFFSRYFVWGARFESDLVFARLGKNYLFLGNSKVRDTLANFSRERIYKREIYWIILFIPRFSVIEGIFFDNSSAMYRNFDLLYDILFFF